MMKKLLYLALLCTILWGVIAVVSKQDQSPKANPPEEELPPASEEEPEHPDNTEPSSTEMLIHGILDLAKNGKVPHTSIIAGETAIIDVYEEWGEPDETVEASNGIYDTFSDHNVSVGYRDGVIFDVRSYHTDLGRIHYDDIKTITGKPDDVRYYKDDTFDQIILVYQVNENFQLKWILSKPTEKKTNPIVHHISVVNTSFHKKENNQSVSEIIENMTLDEKIGQMIIAGISGDSFNQNTKKLISKYKVGGIIFYPENLTSPKQTVDLVNKIKLENQPNVLPIQLGVDQEGGSISRLPGGLIDFPTNEKIGEWNNSPLSYEIGSLLGELVRSYGLNLNFAPVLDVNSNPNNPVIGDRSFGSNVEVVSELGIKTMEGIKSQNVIPVIKHFPGHGDTSVDSHLELPIVNKTLEELHNLELIPFSNAIDAGAEVVMVAHILLPKIDSTSPASMSKTIITDILRNELSFKGVVMTDDMTMKAITNNYEISHAAVESVKAGSDIIMVAHEYENVISTINALMLAVESGELTEKRIDESVKRIIQLKRNFDINDELVQDVNISALNKQIENVWNKYSIFR